MKSDFLIAVTQLAAERNLPKETVIQAIEAALVSAYKKDTLTVGQHIAVRLNPSNGEVKVFTLKAVVDEVTDPRIEVSLAEAHRINQEAVLGDTVELEAPGQNAGRIAAQTAKQVVMQRLREAERELVFEEFSNREGDIITGAVQRIEPRQIIVDLGRTEGVIPLPEQVPTERYRPGQRLKVLVLEVRRTSRGPEIVVSRTHKNLLRRLFELEVPEIYNGVVEIRAVAREPGSRSKVAVFAHQQGIDPVGSCVGLRGIRIQNIVNELQGEKIDVVQWNKDTGIFIANALSPAQALRVDVVEEEQTARVVVPDKHLSLAIGKEGQNARLAAKLTGWRVDIKSASEVEAERLKLVSETRAARVAEVEAPVEEAAEEPVAGAVEIEEEAGVVEEAAVAEAEEAAAPPAVEEPVAVEAAPVLSAEEELAALSVQEEVAKVAASQEAEGIPTEVAFSEEIWKVAQAVPTTPQIRFAEDIIGARPSRSKGRGKKGKATKGEEAGARTRRSGGRRVSYPEPDEDEPGD